MEEMDRRTVWTRRVVVLAGVLLFGGSVPARAQSLLGIGADGTVERLLLGGRAVPVRAALPFAIREAGEEAFATLPYEGRAGLDHVYRLGDRYLLHAALDTVGEAIRLRGRVVHLPGTPAAFTVRLAVPVRLDDGGWVWSGQLDERTPVEQAALLRSVVEARTVSGEAGSVNSTAFGAEGDGDVGHAVGTGHMSFYPFAALSRGDQGVSIGVDMRLPLFFRLQMQQDQGLVFEYDTAVSPATGKFPSETFFTVYLYPHDGTWGLRSSAERYHRLFPESFTRRVEREGIWMPFVDVTGVEGYEDFGFAFLETGSTSRETAATQQAAGVYTFPYTEPWDVQQGRRREGLTYRAEVDRGRADPVLEALSTRDARGQWMIRYMWAPWFAEAYAVSYTLNPDPELSRRHGLRYVYEKTVVPAVAAGHSGIYFDSWEFKWMYDLNYRQEHFVVADYPLVFSGSRENPQPAIWNYTSQYEFGRFVADTLHAQGLLTMGNGFEWIPFTAGLMDLFGSEIDYTQPDTTRREKWRFRRAIAASKPIVLLLNTGLYSPPFVEAPYPGYDRYFQEALYYGFYPSFFSENASDDPYWKSRTHYEIGRPFFKRYIPLIRAVAGAGWQPVTLACATPEAPGAEALGVERFGSGDGPVYFTVRNFTGGAATGFTLQVDLAGLGWDDARVVELLSGEAPATGRDGAVLTVTGRIEPTTTQVFRLTRPAPSDHTK